jgi:hypothetical protein
VGFSDQIKSGAKSTLSDSLKEGWKKVRGWIYVAVSLYALSLLQSLYGLDHIPTWPEAGRLIWASVKNFPSFLRDWFISTPYDLVVENPVQSAALLLLIVGYIILVALLMRANKSLNRQSEILKGADANHALVSQAGIKARYPHAKQTDGGAPWKTLCEEILHPENKFVYILGANGIDTFGGPKSPLYDAMESFRGTFRVILCKPDGTRMKGRAAAVGVTVAEYTRAIKTSVRRLKDLKKKQHAVDARFYDGQPNWKLIITNSTLWIQYYQPGGPHVDQTPVWLVSATEGGDGLYHLFHMEFDRVWARCTGPGSQANLS